MLFGSLFAGLAMAQLAAGHGAILKAVGDMGGSGTALGIDASTPRDGATRKPFQADSTRFKNNNVDACGETLGGGPNEPTEQVTKMVQDSKSMPMISQGGMVMMTLHQVNGDGAGPYKCMIDSTGTGTGGWTDMKVTTNVPGKNSRSKAKAEDFVSSPESGCGQSQSQSHSDSDSDSENKC
ncbi:EKA-like protein [Golovinomyces cichoracearum]|uniref:EKA-like protein n=1 Tax=Golovinomyces cichoracearum TaxID=62708 RepID=A0A420HAU7_9PEZI|nr:EKA-like protein [Golovinomyces cichoracearum]